MADKKKLPTMAQIEISGKKHFPSMINLDEGDYPELKDWTVGSKYKLELIVEQVASSKEDNSIIPSGDSDKEKVHAKFKVLEVLEGEPYEKEGKEDEDEKEEEEKEEPEEKETKKPGKPAAIANAVKRKFGIM